jgi:predicted Zn-dependent peptidase
MAGWTVISRAAAIAASKRATVSRSSRGRDFSAILTATEEFPDVPQTSPTRSTTGRADITKLSNGLIVATEDGSSTSSVSLTFPSGGSSSEAFISEAGAAFANKTFAFKSAVDMSSITILRALENAGASPFTSATRHSASVGYTCAPDKAGPLVGAVICQTASTFEAWDLHEVLKIAKQQAAIAATSPEVSLTDAIFAASYGGESSMGRPFCNTSCTSAGLVSFRKRNYVFDGAVLTATGVDHGSFIKEVEEALGEVPPTAPAPEASSVPFIGGETRLFAPAGGFAHVALSVNAPVSDPATLSVLKHWLSLGGISTFCVPGLLGVYGTTMAAEAGALTDSLLATLSENMSDDTITRAKILAKAEAMFALENGSKSLADSMTMNVLYTGSYTSASVAAALDGITSKDVNDAWSLFKKTGLSLAAVGEIQNVPFHRTISSTF